jgi:hypothetical protein
MLGLQQHTVPAVPLTVCLGGHKEKCFSHQDNHFLWFRQFLHKILRTFSWMSEYERGTWYFTIIHTSVGNQATWQEYPIFVFRIRATQELDNSGLESRPHYVQNRSTRELMVAWLLCARGLRQEYAKRMLLLRTKSSYLIPPPFSSASTGSLSAPLQTMITLPLALL